MGSLIGADVLFIQRRGVKPRGNCRASCRFTHDNDSFQSQTFLLSKVCLSVLMVVVDRRLLDRVARRLLPETKNSQTHWSGIYLFSFCGCVPSLYQRIRNASTIFFCLGGNAQSADV